jgi:hypothetical protein
MASFTITVGRLFWGSIRDLIKEAAFKDSSIQWMESGGLITRRFSVKGDDEPVAGLLRDIDRFVRANQ